MSRPAEAQAVAETACTGGFPLESCLPKANTWAFKGLAVAHELAVRVKTQLPVGSLSSTQHCQYFLGGPSSPRYSATSSCLAQQLPFWAP